MDTKEIIIKPIGIINTPFNDQHNIPIQGRFGDDVKGRCTVYDEFVEGLTDLDGFSHAILIYYFHESKYEEITSKPYLEAVPHGIFAIRSPNRPNHIGFSVVKIKKIEGSTIVFTQVDMIDGTPLLDIKPYVSHFDIRTDVKSGWIDKHFENGSFPDESILKLK